MSLAPDDLWTITRHAKVAQVIYALASLGVPDALQDGPRTAEQVARVVGGTAGRVGRLLRAAASEEVLTYEDGRYGLNEFSRQLCSEGEASVRAALLGWSLLRPGYQGMGYLDKVVLDGGSGVEAAFGESFFSYTASHPEEARRYTLAVESTVESFEAAANGFDFSQFGRVVDVGGGLGGFLVAIIRAHPTVRGVLFDLPHVVAGASGFLASYAESEHIQVLGGDLFTDVPPGGDAYFYSTVFRCFEDDQCVRALRTCARQLTSGAQVLAVEMVMEDGIPPSPGGVADLYAMALYGGRDRTKAEWTDLFGQAGFQPPTFTLVNSPYSVISATLAG